MVMQKFFFSSNFTGPGPKKIPERFFIKNGSAKFFLTKFHRAWAGKKNFSQTVFYKKNCSAKVFFLTKFHRAWAGKKTFPEWFFIKKWFCKSFFFSPNFTGPRPGLEKKLFPNGFFIKKLFCKSFFLTKFHRAWAGKKNFSQTVFL